MSSSGGLPTPPMEATKPALGSRRSLKQGRPSHRASKRASAVQEQQRQQQQHQQQGAVVLDGRHKRVWKACERCRMKKTKCDGESPCKRCKDDGLVCTAGSRRKTEFKQLPRGYAEVLENTQYALIATVQKLYAMVRNGDAWDLGEPELNDRGLPVIHNIAEKLGCIRPSPDLPQAFPEDAEEFSALQAQLFAASRDSSDSSEKQSEDSVFSNLDRRDRASSSDSDHSSMSNDYGQMFWDPEPESLAQGMFAPNPETTTAAAAAAQPPHAPFDSPSLDAPAGLQFRQELNAAVRRSFNPRPVSSPPFADLQQGSPNNAFRSDSPFAAAWPGGSDDFVSPTNMVNTAAIYLRQPQPRQQPQQRPFSSLQQSLGAARPGLGSPSFAGDLPGGLDSARPKGVLPPSPSSAAATATNLDAFASMGAYLDGTGTIRPNLLDCDLNGTLTESMDNVMFNDYDGLPLS